MFLGWVVFSPPNGSQWERHDRLQPGSCNQDIMSFLSELQRVVYPFCPPFTTHTMSPHPPREEKIGKGSQWAKRSEESNGLYPLALFSLLRPVGVGRVGGNGGVCLGPVFCLGLRLLYLSLGRNSRRHQTTPPTHTPMGRLDGLSVVFS